MRFEHLARGPCGRLTKAPLIKGGHNAFSNDPTLIAEWQARFPGALWGLRCGDHFDVLDLDGVEGLNWLHDYESKLPATRVQITPRGRHYYFLPDTRLRPSVCKIAKGVDVRAAGSYVIAWCLEGLPVTDHPIAPWPEWLLALGMATGCSLRASNEMVPIVTQRGHRRPTINLSRRTQQILRVIEQAEPGTRNARLYWAACRFGEIMAEGRLQPEVAEQLLKSAAQICGLVRDDGANAVAATIASGLRRGSNAGT
jgi:hypothetical protein